MDNEENVFNCDNCGFLFHCQEADITEEYHFCSSRCTREILRKAMFVSGELKEKE